MKHFKRLVVTLAALGTTLALFATSAGASTTTIRRDGATGAPYSGNFRANLLSANATFSGTSGGSTLTTTCNFVQIDGTINSDGSGVVTGFEIHNNTATTCPNNAGGTTGLTVVNLPSSFQVVYAPVTGGHDGFIMFNSVKITAVITVFGIASTCHYAGNLSLDVYNKDNPNRPITTAAELEIAATGTSISLDTSQTNGSSCPVTARLNFVLKARGETTAGSGVFDQVLYVTA
jgi:hypothetical protein